MAGQSIGTIGIGLEARLAKFESDFGRAARIAEKEMEKMRRQVTAQLRKVNEEMNAVVGRIKADVGGLFSGVFAGLSAGVFGSFLKHLINVGDEVNDLSKKFGISTNALSTWRLLAEKSGTSLDGIAKAVKFLAKDLDGSEAKLKSMGISLTDIHGKAKPAEKVFEEIAVKVAGYGDSMQKAELMQSLFGKSGADLIPFMDELGKNVEEAHRKAEAFGVAIGPEFAEMSDHFNDNARDSKAAVEGFGNAILKSVLPGLNQFIDKELELIEKNGTLIKSGEAVGGWLKDFAIGVVLAKNAVDVLIDGVKFFGTAIATVFEIAGKQAGALGTYFTVLGEELTDFTGNPIERIKKIGVAFDSLVGTLKGNVAEGLNSLSRGADDFGEKFNKNVEDVTNAFEVFGTDIPKDLDKVGDAAKKQAPKIKTLADAEKELAAAEKARREAEAAARKEAEYLNQARERGAQFLFEYHKRQVEALRTILDWNKESEKELKLAGLTGEARRMAANQIEAETSATKTYFMLLDAGYDVTLEMLAVEIELRAAKLNLIDATLKLTAVTEDYINTLKEGGHGAIRSFLSDLLSGEKGMKHFGETLLDIGKRSLDKLVDMFDKTVLTPGGGGLSQFATNINKGSMYGPGGTGSSVSGWMSAVGSAYSGWQNARNGGSALNTVASFAMSGATIGGVWGAAIGAVVGLFVAAFVRAKPPDVRLGGAGADVRKAEGTFQTAFGTVQIGTRATDQTPIREAVQKFDETLAAMIGSVRGGEEQLAKIRASLFTWSVDLKGDANSITNLLDLRFARILSTFDADIQQFVNGAEKLEDKVQRLGDAFAAQATFADLGLDVSFGQFLQLVDELQIVGESTSATMQRVLGATQLLGDALEFLGVDLQRSGTDFIKFANAIAEAAGGFDTAKALWDGFLNRFFSPEEIATRAVANFNDIALTELADIGLDVIPTMQQFREDFEAALPSLSPEEIVQWLQAGNAIADLADAEDRLAGIRGQGADVAREAAEAEERLRQNRMDLSALLNDVIWDDYLAGLDEHDRALAELHHDFQLIIDRAIELGATERELAVIRERERRATERLNAEIDDLIETLVDPRGSIYQIPTPTDTSDRDSALKSIADYLSSLAFSPLSPFTPKQKLDEAQRQFDAAIIAARSGNVDAMQRLPQLHETLLQLANAYYASGPDRDRIFAESTAKLANLLDRFGVVHDPLLTMATTINQFIPQIAESLAQIAASPLAQPVASYDTGTSYVPHDQLAMVHEGEMIVDAQARNMMKQYGVQPAVVAKPGPDREGRSMQRAILRELKRIKSGGDTAPARLADALDRIRVPGSRGSG